MKPLQFNFLFVKQTLMQRSFIFMALLLMTVSAKMSAAQSSATYELSNANVDIAVDAGGHLIKLVNVKTGHNYLASAGHDLWKMYYKTSDARELEIPAAKQKAQVRKEGNSIIIYYPSLTGNVALVTSSRQLKVAFTLRAELQDDRVTWTATIKNSEPEPFLQISELWIPMIDGIGNMGKGAEADNLYWPEDGGRKINNPYAKLTGATTARGDANAASANRRGGGFRNAFYRITYPWPASMQWYTLNNGDEGLYIGSHDKSLMTTTLNVMANRDGLVASMVKYPFVKYGETWTSAPTIMRVFTGDWHEGARFYRSWASTWMPKPNPPQWLRHINGWIIPNLKAQNGSRYVGVYADLPRYYRDAHKVGIDLISIYGWMKEGFDNWYPDYTPDPGMGGEAGLKAAIEEIKKDGGHVNLYSQGQLIDPGTEYYRRVGYKQSAKDIWGGEYRETYGGSGSGTLLTIQQNKLFAVACPGAPGWFDQLSKQFDMARYYGVTGVMYDQIAGRPPYICYDTTHNHAKPSLAFGAGKYDELTRLRKLIKDRDPQFAFLNELVVDVFSGIDDITQPVNFGFVPSAESYGELFKYTFPDRIITNRTNQERKRCFGYGFALQWRVDGMMFDTTDPIMAPYLTRLNELRTKYADLLLDGKFVDNEGFTSGNTNLFSYSYLGGNRMAVTLWNDSGAPQKPEINAPGYKLESANWQDSKWEGTDHQIAPGDVAVMIFAKQ
jgi:hypothetical protein